MTDVRELLNTAGPSLVAPLDLGQAVRRGRSRRRRTAAGSAVGACVVLSVVAVTVQSVLPTPAGPGPVAAASPAPVRQSAPDGESVRAAVERWADLAGYVPAMPVEPPEGYDLVFAGGTFVGRPGRTAVSICTRPVGDDSLGSCFPSEDDPDRPWFATTTVDGRSDVVVTAVSEPWSREDLARWRDVAFTTDLTGLAWMDEREPGTGPAPD
jgi:hypothetical protein